MSKNGYFSKGTFRTSYLLLFYHSINGSIYFVSEKEFLHSNEVKKYSLFGYLDDNFRTNEGVFEFILEYPELKKFGHWTQKINPLLAEPNSDVDVSIKSDSTWELEDDMPFIGLHQSNQPNNTFLEGCNSHGTYGNDEYFFSVGVKKQSWRNSIPAYSSKVTAYEVYLWIKITNPLILSIYFKPQTYKIHNFAVMHFTYIFIMNL